MSRPEFEGIFSNNTVAFSRNYEIMRKHPQTRSISSIINLSQAGCLTKKPETIYQNYSQLTELIGKIAEKTPAHIPFTTADLGSAAVLVNGTLYDKVLDIRRVGSVYLEALRSGWYSNIQDRYKVAADFSSFALTYNFDIENIYERFLDLKTTDFLKEDGVVTDGSLATLTIFSYWIGVGETINKEGQVVTKRFLSLPDRRSWQDAESQSLMAVTALFSNNPGGDLSDYNSLFLSTDGSGLGKSRDMAKALYILFKRMTGVGDKEALGLYKQLMGLKGVRENIDVLQMMLSIGALQKNIHLTTQRYANGGVSLVFLSNPKT